VAKLSGEAAITHLHVVRNAISGCFIVGRSLAFMIASAAMASSYNAAGGANNGCR
jgi:hypothetical protein